MSVERGVVSATTKHIHIAHASLREWGGYSPEEGQDLRLWTGLPRSALEADQTNASAALPTASCLPLLDMRPRALVHGVVDGYDDLHVRRTGIVIFTRHSRVELRLRGVHPVFLAAARDGGDLARGGEQFWHRSGVIIGACEL